MIIKGRTLSVTGVIIKITSNLHYKTCMIQWGSAVPETWFRAGHYDSEG